MSTKKHSKRSDHKRPDRRSIKRTARKREGSPERPQSKQDQGARENPWANAPASEAGQDKRLHTGELLRYLDRQAGHSCAPKELSRALGLHKSDDIRAFQLRIKHLIRKGELVQKGPLIRSAARYESGLLEVHPDGFGFLRVAGRSEDVYMPQNEIRELIHGDRIEVALENFRGRDSGRFVRVLEPAPSEMVARIERSGSIVLANPRSRRFPRSILVDADKLKDANHGDWVKLSFDRDSHPLRGAVLEVLGQNMDATSLIDIVQQEHQLPNDFPDPVLRESRQCPREVDASQHQTRQDFTHIPFVTIDGADARDFDDAICVTPRGEGYELWVAIADVAHYVRQGGALDTEAKERGNSFYFPDRVIPMLPEALSNGLCSLNPYVVRLAMVVRMRMDANGRCRSVRMYEGIIRSRARLTYHQVARWLEEHDQTAVDEPLIRDMLHHGLSLTRRLLLQREQRGALELDLPESTMVLEYGKVTAIKRSERNIAHRMIEEMMLATNIAVAEELEKNKKPFLYRTHPAPEMTAVNQLNEFLAPLGLPIPLPRKGGSFRPADLQRVLYLADRQPWGHVLHRLMLRSMQQASYNTNNQGHFGLAYRNYCHFTSPIRRYADLTIHRQVKAMLRHQADPYGEQKKELAAIGSHISGRERVAQRAEWDARDMLAALYHGQHTGEEMVALVSGITKRRVFFELLESCAEGSIALDKLPGDFEWDEHRHCLRSPRGGLLLSLGDTVTVRIDNCDPTLGQINLSLVEK
ncbi:MAG: ribonuclease R [Mariprofundaceae bacterium]|nr:ribonuclease R [Mariprofundaceae bacterium]